MHSNHGPCFTTNARCRPFKWAAPCSQDTSWRACRKVIAKSVLLAATPASPRDERQRQAQASQQQHGDARAPRSNPSKRGASRRPGLSWDSSMVANVGSCSFQVKSCRRGFLPPPPDARGIALNIMWLRHIVAKELVPLRGRKPLPSEQCHGCLEHAENRATRHIWRQLAYNMLREVGIAADSPCLGAPPHPHQTASH